MTWRKTGQEFDDECAVVEMSDAAYRTHQEAIGFIYKMKNEACEITKGSVRRFAASPHAQEAIKELIALGFWRDHGSHYEVVHHADVIADSLHAQAAKKERDRRAQKAARERKAKAEQPQNVSADISADTRQTDRQTDKQLGAGPTSVCKHGTPNGHKVEPWSDVGALVCGRCEQERRSA